MSATHDDADDLDSGRNGLDDDAVREGALQPRPARAAGIRAAVRAGLTATPKCLPPVLFYDQAGSLLFERIGQCPEYYLTRTERRILGEHAAAIAAALPREVTLVELGCGSAEKTELVLRALLAERDRVRYVACDVSAPALQRCTERLRALPGLDVVPLAGDFAHAVREAPRRVRGACLWTFLGSSIGNFEPPAAIAFLAGLRRAAAGHLLLGTDMVKDPRLLNAAYDDAAGVTAMFNRNVLHRINRELDADFVPERFAHCARYWPAGQRVEMHLVSGADHAVQVRALDLTVRFARGETIHTESSHKYTPADLRRMARASGFAPRRELTDDAGWFTVSLWAPA